MMKIVATTSLPAFDRPNAGRWNANTRAKNGALRETLVIYQQTKRLRVQAIPSMVSIILFIVATNVVASQQPNCYPTGMLTAHAKIGNFLCILVPNLN